MKKKNISASEDIVKLILADHKPLKSLIKVMKEPQNSLAKRRKAFAEFAPILVAHAKPEEKSWYKHMKTDDVMRVEGLEGDVEHHMADQLISEIRSTTNEELWTARVKVLAEIVEHHIEEEEKEMLPKFKKEVDLEHRIAIGREYLQFKELFVEKNPNRAAATHSQAHLQ